MITLNNNLLKTLTVMLLIFSVASCKKYLTVTPVSSFGEDYIFDNTTNADLAVLGVYGALGGDQAYGIRLSMYYPFDNDEMMGQSGAAGDNERRDIARYNTQPSNTQLAGPFNQLYSGVERANICIDQIPQMTQYNAGNNIEKQKLRHLHGEALTLRAQFYYELIRNWGDLPAQFLPSKKETNLFKAKTDRDSIYDRLLSDLAEAAILVPWRTQAGVSNERITQGAVRALRARIALARGGYALRRNRKMERPANYKDFYKIARDECAAIMAKSTEHKLNASYQAIFKDAICAYKEEPNGEVIWEVGMTGGGSGFGDSKLGYYNGPRYNNTGNSALTILPTFFYAFDSTDTRRDVTCIAYNIQQDFSLVARSLPTMVDGKFRRDWTNQISSAAQYFGINWPMIRMSDVLLMYAETENELNNGPTATAKEAFERVRLRAYAGNAALIGVTPSTYAGFFNALVKERMLELGGEGIRKFDLIRWNMLGQKMIEVKAEMVKMVAKEAPYDLLPATMYYELNQKSMKWLNSFYQPSPLTAPPGSAGITWIGSGITTTIINILGSNFEPNKRELQPLPQSALDANPNLIQDYGF